MKVLGIVPARAGSKGIPGKNKKILCGKPLIQYPLEAALNSKLNDIIVSTDDDDIRQIVIDLGIKVIIRPKELSGDLIPTLPVLLHALNSLNKQFDAVMTLQPTSPLRTSRHINESLDLFEQFPLADSLVSIVRVPHNYLPMSLMVKKEQWLDHYEMGTKLMRRQDKPVLYARNGAAIYLTRTNRLNNFIIGGNILGYEMEYIESIDVDDIKDLKLAEIILNSRSL